MTAPGVWTFVLLAAAAWRTWMLLAHDEILDGARDRVYGLDEITWEDNRIDVKYRRPRLLRFVECPYCLGFWLAVAWWAAWTAWDGTAWLAAPWAISAALVAIDHAIDLLGGE